MHRKLAEISARQAALQDEIRMEAQHISQEQDEEVIAVLSDVPAASCSHGFATLLSLCEPDLRNSMSFKYTDADSD